MTTDMNLSVNVSAIDASRVKTLPSEMPIAADVFDIYKDRERGRQDTSFPRISRLLAEKGKKYSMKDWISFCKAMEEAKVGRLVYSRNKAPRFIWHYNLKSVARFALGLAQEDGRIEKQNPPRVVLPKVLVVDPSQNVQKPKTVLGIKPGSSEEEVTIKTPHGYEVTLPLDLTPDQTKVAAILLKGLSG